MFYPKQFETLVQDASQLTKTTRTGEYTFDLSLPGAHSGKVDYKPIGVDEQGDEYGSIVIYWGDENKTECDCLQYAIDAIGGLVRQYEREGLKYEPDQSLGDDIDTAMMDHYDRMNGDIGDIDVFEESVIKSCKNKHLVESTISLYRATKR